MVWDIVKEHAWLGLGVLEYCSDTLTSIAGCELENYFFIYFHVFSFFRKHTIPKNEFYGYTGLTIYTLNDNWIHFENSDQSGYVQYNFYADDLNHCKETCLENKICPGIHFRHSDNKCWM